MLPAKIVGAGHLKALVGILSLSLARLPEPIAVKRPANEGSRFVDAAQLCLPVQENARHVFAVEQVANQFSRWRQGRPLVQRAAFALDARFPFGIAERDLDDQRFAAGPATTPRARRMIALEADFARVGVMLAILIELVFRNIHFASLKQRGGQRKASEEASWFAYRGECALSPT